MSDPLVAIGEDALLVTSSCFSLDGVGLGAGFAGSGAAAGLDGFGVDAGIGAGAG